MDHVVELFVTGEAVLHSFGKDDVELMIEPVNCCDAGRAGSHRVLVIGLELEEVEVIPAIIDLRGALKGTFRCGEDGETGREGEGFLAAGEEHVDAHFVDFDRHDGEARDGVCDEEDVFVFIHHGGDFGEWIHHAGGGLVVDESDDVELAGGKLRINRGGIDGDAPLKLERFGLFPASAGDIDPLVGKGSRAAAEHLFDDEVADRAFHHTPGGGGGEKNGLFGAH